MDMISLVGSESNCKEAGCTENALSLSLYCWDHTPDKPQYIETLKKYLKAGNSGNRFFLRKVIMRRLELVKINLSQADLSQADISGSALSYSDISKANLIGCNMQDCDLTCSRLAGSDLTRAVLKNARLWHADMSFANLSESDLTHADLWKCSVYSAKLWHAEIRQARSMTRQNFHKKTAAFWHEEKIDESGAYSAEEAYRSLKQYFTGNGLYQDASWASYKEKIMEKIRLIKDKDIACLPALLMELVCGYGERPARVVIASIGLILCYALIYWSLGTVFLTADAAAPVSYGQTVYYSIVTFTTLGYGDFVPKPNTAYRLLSGSEALIGAFMIGLFVFTLSRKYSAR